MLRSGSASPACCCLPCDKAEQQIQSEGWPCRGGLVPLQAGVGGFTVSLSAHLIWEPSALSKEHLLRDLFPQGATTQMGCCHLHCHVG